MEEAGLRIGIGVRRVLRSLSQGGNVHETH
jgi:hypothetical protein